MLSLIGVSVLSEKHGEEGLFAPGTVSSHNYVGTYGLPQLYGVDPRLADGTADATGGAHVGIVLELVDLVLVQGLGAEELSPEAVLASEELPELGDLEHGGDLGPILVHIISGAPLHAFLASGARIQLHKLGGHEES